VDTGYRRRKRRSINQLGNESGSHYQKETMATVIKIALKKKKTIGHSYKYDKDKEDTILHYH
jgi:hypothetical protein